MINKIEKEFIQHQKTLEQSLNLKEQITMVAQELKMCLKSGGKI